jgi:hypothetical protein
VYANAKLKQKYGLPEVIVEDPKVILDLKLHGALAKFVTYSQGTFVFSPKD